MLNRRSFLKMCGTLAMTGGLAGWLDVHMACAAQTIPVLLYHRVGFTTDSLTVRPDRFGRDLQELQESGYNSINLDQLQQFLAGKYSALPQNPILLTFDDGYLDNYQYAFPALKKAGMTGAFFLITSMMGKPERLGRAQMKEMQAEGMSFGSHTVNHNPLGDMKADFIEYELTASKVALEELLGQEVAFIAYPRGSYNPTTLRYVQQAEYTGAFTTTKGLCTASSTWHALNRIPVFSYSNSAYSLIQQIQ